LTGRGYIRPLVLASILILQIGDFGITNPFSDYYTVPLVDAQESTSVEPRMWVAIFLRAGDGVFTPDVFTFGIDLPGTNVFADPDNDNIIDIGMAVAQGTERFHADAEDIVEVTSLSFLNEEGSNVAFTPPLIGGALPTAVIIDSALTVDDINDFFDEQDFFLPSGGLDLARTAEIREQDGDILGQTVNTGIVPGELYDLRLPKFDIIRVDLTDLRTAFNLGATVVKIDAIDPACMSEDVATAFGETCVHASQVADFQLIEFDARDTDTLATTGDDFNLAVPPAALPSGGLDSWDALVSASIDGTNLETGFDRDPLIRRIGVGAYRPLDLERVADLNDDGIANGSALNDIIRVTVLLLSGGGPPELGAGYARDEPIETILPLPQRIATDFRTSIELKVSAAENPAFENHFFGAQIVQVIIDDPLGTFPDTTTAGLIVNGFNAFRVHLSDGHWYAFFVEDQGFGVLMDILTDGTRDNRIAISKAFNDAGTPVVIGGSNYVIDTAVDDSFVAEIEIVGGFPHVEVNQEDIFPSLPPPFFENSQAVINPDLRIGVGDEVGGPGEPNDFNAICDSLGFGGDAGLSRGSGALAGDPDCDWPYIRLIGLQENDIVEISAGSENVTLIFDDFGDSIVSGIDREADYPLRSEVIPNFTDFMWNINPVENDTLFFVLDRTTGNPTNILYQPVPNFNPGNGGPNFPDLLPALTSSPGLEFDERQVLSIDPDGVNALGFINAHTLSTFLGVPLAPLVTFVQEPFLRIFENSRVVSDPTAAIGTFDASEQVFTSPISFPVPNPSDLQPVIAMFETGPNTANMTSADSFNDDSSTIFAGVCNREARFNYFDIVSAVAIPCPPNSRPSAEEQSALTDEDTPIIITLTGSDSDSDTLAFSLIAVPTNGTLSDITPLSETSAQVTYTSDPNFNGADSFAFRVVDDFAGSDTATVGITVNAINDVPTANDDFVVINEDTTGTDVLANDIDVDGDFLTIISVTLPANGTTLIAGNGIVTYTPEPNFNGADSFEYTISDGHGGNDTATVNITVNSVNDAPIANAGGPYFANEGTPIAFDGSASSDSDGSITDYSWDFGDGTSDAGANPSHAYADNGVYTVTLTVTDNEGAMHNDTATATIDNIAPSIETESSLNGIIGQAILFAAGFSDPGTADTHTILWEFGDNSTSDLLEAEHVYNSLGNFTAILTVTDDDGGSAAARVNVTVTSSLDAHFCGKAIEEFDRVIDGTGNNDVLVGTRGNDLIRGFGGDDTINGRGGHDCLIGGSGNDTIEGRAGNDAIEGNSGDDNLSGGGGSDTIAGGSGNDVITGGAKSDMISGGIGDDSIDGGRGSDSCGGGSGRNIITTCESALFAVETGAS